MEIKTYNSAQLNELIQSDSFRRMPVVPISTHRAISHIHNPRADKEDVLLIMAVDDGEMTGYLGILPDRIYNAKDESFKCGWLSCMWVNPSLRGKGIAKQLLATAFSSWQDRILVTEFTPEAKGLYDRSGGFNDLRANDGLRCYLRFNLHEVLPKKDERFKPYLPILKLVDSIVNVPIDLRLSLLQTQKSFALRFDPVREIDEEMGHYILRHQKNQFERRNADELNWIIKYPWLKESKSTDESTRYHFSSVSNRFCNLCFKLTINGEIQGYLHLTIRDNHLRIPYAYFDSRYLNEVVQYLYKIMRDYKLNMLTVFHKEIVAYMLSGATPFIYKRGIKRQYIISKVLDSHFAEKDELAIQDGDADCAFT
jgi:GNAT superfamily N-acetyltransferase